MQVRASSKSNASHNEGRGTQLDLAGFQLPNECHGAQDMVCTPIPSQRKALVASSSWFSSLNRSSNEENGKDPAATS